MPESSTGEHCSSAGSVLWGGGKGDCADVRCIWVRAVAEDDVVTGVMGYDVVTYGGGWLWWGHGKSRGEDGWKRRV